MFYSLLWSLTLLVHPVRYAWSRAQLGVGWPCAPTFAVGRGTQRCFCDGERVYVWSIFWFSLLYFVTQQALQRVQKTTSTRSTAPGRWCIRNLRLSALLSLSLWLQPYRKTSHTWTGLFDTIVLWWIWQDPENLFPDFPFWDAGPFQRNGLGNVQLPQRPPEPKNHWLQVVFHHSRG